MPTVTLFYHCPSLRLTKRFALSTTRIFYRRALHDFKSLPLLVLRYQPSVRSLKAFCATQMSASRFAVEITDAIIDYLHRDKKALAGCSLVCRAWVPASRYHLFDTLWIRAHTALWCFRILQSPFCTLWPYIRHLKVYDQRYYTDTVLRNPKGLKLSKLVAVETLVLHSMRWPANNQLGVALLSGFGRVRDLEICNSHFKTVADVLDFVNAFPLDRLVLNGNKYKSAGPLTLHMATQPGRARTISVYLKSILYHELMVLAQLLRALGPLLIHLQLGAPDFLREAPEGALPFLKINLPYAMAHGHVRWRRREPFHRPEPQHEPPFPHVR